MCKPALISDCIKPQLVYKRRRESNKAEDSPDLEQIPTAQLSCRLFAKIHGEK